MFVLLSNWLVSADKDILGFKGRLVVNLKLCWKVKVEIMPIFSEASLTNGFKGFVPSVTALVLLHAIRKKG